MCSDKETHEVPVPVLGGIYTEFTLYDQVGTVDAYTEWLSCPYSPLNTILI